MEHEDIYLLMMDALDNELTGEQHHDLETHLLMCSTCMQEWQALLAIDTLFRQTPALAPMAGFAERTLVRLPNRRYRLWAMGVLYLMLLLGGTLPMFIGVWLVSQLGGIFSQPDVVQRLWQPVSNLLQIFGTVLRAILSSLGGVIAQQPMVLGWLFLMVGVVWLWSGVYQQLVFAPRPLHISTIGE